MGVVNTRSRMAALSNDYSQDVRNHDVPARPEREHPPLGGRHVTRAGAP